MEGNNNKSGESKCYDHSSHNVIEMHDKLQHMEREMEVMYEDGKTSRRMPVLFERSVMGCLNPRFDSENLESRLKERFFPQDQRKFRSALVYVMLSCLCWIVFFVTMKTSTNHWVAHTAGASVFIFITILTFILTYLKIYSKHYYLIHSVYAFLVCLFCLLRFLFVGKEDIGSQMLMSSVGSFCSGVEVILLIYNLIPLPLYAAFTLSLLFTAIFKGLFSWRMIRSPSVEFIICVILLLVCVHVVCFSLHLMSTIRKHSTFLRICQSHFARKQLRDEKKLKEDIIYSLMPEKVAKWAMQNRNAEDQEVSLWHVYFCSTDDHLCVLLC